MENLISFVQTINNWMWNSVLLILLCGTGIYFTFKLKFVQIRQFKAGFLHVFGDLFKKKDKNAQDGGMSSFQALATAIAAQVGTGNLAGAASAIAVGGPGAIFWMWVSAFFGMATIYGEATLAQQYKQTSSDGSVTGGPVYYIREAFKGTFGKVLAGAFSIFIILALGFMGNMVQSNSIGGAFSTAFNVNPLYVGIVVALMAFFVVVGGVKRIASFTELIVPLMALFYIVGSLFIIITRISYLPDAFRQIIVGAFAPQALAGGVVGATVQMAMRQGVARGLFSNEAGMGSTPHAHAIARVKHPCEQGTVAIISVFIDTFIILNLTAFVILTTGVLTPDGSLKAIALTQAAFSSVMGSFGNVFIAICLLFFAFSTIIGWYFFGEANIIYLFGKKAVKPYAVIVCLFVVLGSYLKVDIVWELSDMFNGLMVIPNLLGLLALGGVVAKLSKDFDKIHAGKKD